MVLGDESTTCPLPTVPAWFWEHVVEAWRHYENGYLLFEGGILDQPTWYYTAMARMSGLMGRREG